MQDYLKNNSRFSILIDSAPLPFSKDAVKVDTSTFRDIYLDSVKRKLVGFEWEDLKNDSEVQACIDTALYADK